MKMILIMSLSLMMIFGLVFASIPDAFALPGHSITYNPATKIIPLAGTIQAQIRVQVPQVAAVAAPIVTHVLDKLPAGFAVPANNAQCEAAGLAGFAGLDFSAAGGDIQTLLQDSGTVANDPVGVFYTGNTGNILVATLNVGPIGAANPIAAASAGILTHDGLGGLADPLEGAPVWRQIFGQNVGSNGIPNAVLGTGNFVVACGCDDFGADGLCTAGVDTDGVSIESYIVAKPVAGELIPVSTTSLLVAGISTNALWILSALAAAAGAGFALLSSN